MMQYEVWLADLPEPAGERPVLLLSRNAAYAYLSRVLVAEVTTRSKLIPQEISLGPREGVRVGSVARFDNLRAIPKSRLLKRMGGLSSAREIEVKVTMGFTLDWPELTQLLL